MLGVSKYAYKNKTQYNQEVPWKSTAHWIQFTGIYEVILFSRNAPFAEKRRNGLAPFSHHFFCGFPLGGGEEKLIRQPESDFDSFCNPSRSPRIENAPHISGSWIQAKTNFSNLFFSRSLFICLTTTRRMCSTQKTLYIYVSCTST